jgi:hypothetical protein
VVPQGIELTVDCRDLSMSVQSLELGLRHRKTPERLLVLALLSMVASTAPSAGQGTAEQRQACTPDVFKLCSMFIPDTDQITACLKDKAAELSDPCRLVISGGAKPPVRSLDTGKRTTR